MAALTDVIIGNPLASLSLLSLLIPILIHLFNPNRGKIVLIGNLHLIKKVKNKKVTEIKIRQWILLAVRLLFFTTLTLLLMDLLFAKTIDSQPEKSLFVTNAWLAKASQKEKQDLLIEHAENKIYLMQPGFKRIDNRETLKTSSTKPYSLDSLISEAVAKQLLTSDNQIYFDQTIDFFAEDRNPLVLNNHPEITMNWIPLQGDLNIPSASIKVFYSTDRITDFKTLQPAFDALIRNNNKLTVDYHPLPKKMDEQTLDKLRNELANSTQANLYFWLSSETVPKALIKQVELGSYLLRDSKQSNLTSEYRNHSILDFEFDIYHQLPTTQLSSSVTIWNSGNNILLSYQPLGRGRLLQFNSRFNPNWNNLNDGAVIVSFLNELLGLFYNQKLLQVSDAQLLNSVFSQIENSKSDSQSKSKTPSIGYQNNRGGLILILVIVWLLERMLSESRSYRHD